MKMTVQEIEETLRSIASEYDGDLSIVGVTAADGESDHAELLIELCLCDRETCMVQINVPRANRQVMERVLRDRLQSLLADERATEPKD
jgi:hypothetical protein